MSVLSKPAQAASFLILFQLVSRASTFVVNQVLLRYLTPETLGLSAQLDLLVKMVIAFARDSFEVAAQRYSQDTQAIVNLAYLSIAFGAPLAYGLASTYAKADIAQVPYFSEALWLYTVSSVIELLATPAYVAAQQRLLFKVKASAESTATLSRCLFTCATALVAARIGILSGLLPFAAGQFAFATMMLLVYLYKLVPFARAEKFSLLPKQIKGYDSDHVPSNSADSYSDDYIGGFLSKHLCKLTASLFLQNSFKFVLAQGDGILVATLASLADQGAYALASNYGGLIARILFQPIEEISRTSFGQLCGPIYTESTHESVYRLAAKEEKHKKNILTAKTLLSNILKFYSLICLVAVTTGPTIAPILLRLVAGTAWTGTQAEPALVGYCYYIPLLAINGVTEAFVTAVASNRTLHIQSMLMVIWSVAFAASAWLFIRVLEIGARGLVFANCVNMGLRIAFNARFFITYFAEKGEVREAAAKTYLSDDLANLWKPFHLTRVLPTPMSLAAAIATWAILYANVSYPVDKDLYLGASISCILPIAAFLLIL